MEFIWTNYYEKNQQLIFELKVSKKCDKLVICAADFYQLFINDKFVAFGPTRTATGYAIPRTFELSSAKKIVIKVLGYNVRSYACDLQSPFFSTEVFDQTKVVYSSKDFSCYINLSRKINMPKFSSQRGFTEGYDLTANQIKEIKTQAVNTPKILEAQKDRATYKHLKFDFINKKSFEGFDQIITPYWMNNGDFAYTPDQFNIERDFLNRKESLLEINYNLKTIRSGFISLNITTKKPCALAVVFEEYLPDGKWIFRRSNCNDYVYLSIPSGNTTFLSVEPYALKYLKIICDSDIKITPKLITYENDYSNCVKVKGDKNFTKIFNAALNTFKQNAVDVFTDCPSRERAGWLCDSFFTAKAELLFTGNNDIEKTFLTNLLIAENEELPKGMMPMCFPAQHVTYIPNWAMWFMIEIEDYYYRSNDISLIRKAKKKIYDVIDYFKKYINEYGLLENLDGWVFVEWSVCNNEEYIKGVNFPSNMLYAFALQKIGELYNDKQLIKQANDMQKTILNLSFTGDFFVDNAIRINDKLVPQLEHISETCQYYALFTGLIPSQKFKDTMINDFGIFRKDKFANIGKSNIFIGNYLRYLWLCKEKEFDRVINESLSYFKNMAEKTGTLWEHDQPTASCCHGFASSIAVILLNCVCGYLTTKNCLPVFEKDFKQNSKIKISFNYKKS